MQWTKDQEDPEWVENVRNSEILKLSVTNRTAALEETHGVRCVAPEESPGMIKEALAKLATALDKLPEEEKVAFIKSQKPSKRIFPDGTKATSAFVNSDDFRLRFLRAELFDASRAAKRMAKFLDVVVDFFGDVGLYRPIKLADLTAEDMKGTRGGLGQWLPYRDRHGRRVFFATMNEKMEELSQRFRLKMLCYMLYTHGTNDVELQQKGVVIVLWCQEHGLKYLKVTPESSRLQMDDFAPMRVSAFHICTPDTPFLRFARGVWTLASGRNIFSRIRLHVGEAVELQYALKSHGISTGQIPITWTGKVKNNYHKQWLRIRHLVEECNMGDVKIVECPKLHDVIFRQGTALMEHPGNVLFRSRIQNFYEESASHPSSRATRDLVSRLMSHIRENNWRVLVWYQEKKGDSYWMELTDREQVYTKVENLVRELKFSKEKYQVINRGHQCTSVVPRDRVQVSESSTSAFLSGQKRPSSCMDENSSGCFSQGDCAKQCGK